MVCVFHQLFVSGEVKEPLSVTVIVLRFTFNEESHCGELCFIQLLVKKIVGSLAQGIASGECRRCRPCLYKVGL